MYRYSSSLKYLAFAEFFDSVGEFNLSDRYFKIAHRNNKNIKKADVNHWTKFTNFNEVKNELIKWQDGFLNYPDIFEKGFMQKCGTLKTTVNGELIEIPVYFDPFDNSSYYGAQNGRIIIGNYGDAGRAVEVLAHEINHAYEDILEIKKVGAITRPFKNFEQLSQNNWSQNTIEKFREAHPISTKGMTDEDIIYHLNNKFGKLYNEINNKMRLNDSIIETPQYWEELASEYKFAPGFKQSLTNDLKKMTLGYREYYRLQNELRSRLSEILYRLSNDPVKQNELLNATKTGKGTREIFEDYFKSVLGENYSLLAPEQKKYILNNVYQSFTGGRQQTITNKIINFTQNGIRNKIFPENIGRMKPVEIKQLFKKPELQEYISLMRANTGYADDELINLIQKAANSQIEVQTAANSGEFSFMAAKQGNPALSNQTMSAEQMALQSRLSPGMVGKTQGVAGNALNAKNVVIGASELEAKTLELRNIAISLKNILNKQINIPSWLTKSLTTILEFVERYIPQAVKTFFQTNKSTINTTFGYGYLIFELYNTLINLRNAIYIYQKSSELPATEKELKNDFNLQARGQLATAITSFAGVLGNPKSPIPIKDPVVMSVLTAANLIGQTFGGTETSASFADIDMASTSYVGYQNAAQAVNGNPNLKSIWPSIKSLVENNLTGNFGTLLQSTLANYNQISNAEKSILTSAAIGYRQELRKQKGLTNTPQQQTQFAQPAQIPNQATPNSYFALAKISNPQSYIGTKEQEEALRAAITKKHQELGKLPKNQIYKDFYEAYFKTFGKWDQQPAQRARNLNLDVNKQTNQPQNKIFKPQAREIVQQNAQN